MLTTRLFPFRDEIASSNEEAILSSKEAKNNYPMAEFMNDPATMNNHNDVVAQHLCNDDVERADLIVCQEEINAQAEAADTRRPRRRRQEGNSTNWKVNKWSKFSFVEAILIIFLTLSSASRFFQEVKAIKLQPEGREKFYWSGEQFVITCQNSNNIKNVKIRWLGPDGNYITDDRSKRVHAESTGPHSNRLHVMNATASVDDGQYKCLIGSTDDKSPRETIEFNLKIFLLTSFKETQSHMVLPVGQQGVLNCRVEFDPSVLTSSVEWVREQTPIELLNDSSSTYTVIEYDAAKKLSQLIINPLARHHDGYYTCRAVAVTSHLSKISDFNIRLETIFAPSFEEPTQTIWVERQSSREQHGAGARVGQSNHYQQRGNRLKPSNKPFMNARRNEENQEEAQHANSSAANIIRIELRCSCQSNPSASIFWSSNDNSRFVLTKGEPQHVLEEPRLEVDGHNTTSVLTIGYSLDPDWPHRRAKYLCSASNRLGDATKTFAIEQGDPPPAFNINQSSKNYNSQTSLFQFTMLGPNFDPDSQAPEGGFKEQPEILPLIDSFRIRAENSALASESTGKLSHHHGKSGKKFYQHHHPGNEMNSVQFGFKEANGKSPAALSFPQNFTISLAKLPSGTQRLYLEAHNAVGWSPNSTYLGEFYIVSGSNSTRNNSANFLFVLSSTLLLVLIYMHSTNKRNKLST